MNESTPIERVELHYAKTGSGAEDQWNMDDLVIIPAAVPEPATMGLIGAGLLAFVRRR